MRKLIILMAMFTLSTAFADTKSDVKPEKNKADIAMVQKLQVLSDDQARIQLVLVDNGGSTDVSSLLSPSSVYLTIYLEGEMFDTSVTYLVNEHVTNLVSASYDKKNKVAVITTIGRAIDPVNGNFPRQIVTTKVSIKNALKEVFNAKEGDGPIKAVVRINP